MQRGPGHWSSILPCGCTPMLPPHTAPIESSQGPGSADGGGGGALRCLGPIANANGGSMAEGTALADRIPDQRAGAGDPRALLGEFRRALVLVPLAGGGLWTAEFGGVRWVCGFTDEAALARFAQERVSAHD